MLTDAERAEVRQLLEDMLQEAQERLDQLTKSSKPVSLDDPIGRLSRIDAIQGQQMALAGHSREHQRVEDIKHALRSVGNADFGLCTTCKRPIGIDRIMFQPEVMRCVRCA
jgi:DnaK suppressor protein